QQPGATCCTGNTGHWRQIPPPAVATQGVEHAAARGHLQHRPTGRSTGSTPPTVATLGAGTAEARSHLWHRQHRPAGRSNG
ncbi:hypothetical protein ACSZN0_19960, partial [Aeromonas caviae]